MQIDNTPNPPPLEKRDIVKSSIKNRSGTYGETRKTLPLEGGGKRVGVRKA
jgi:hypothetical protein